MSQLYGVTYADVQALTGREITSTGRPTQAQVASWITESADQLNGLLENLGCTPASIAADSGMKAFAAEMLVLHVAVKLGRVGFTLELRDTAESWSRDYWRMLQIVKDDPEILGAGGAGASSTRLPSTTDPRSTYLRTARGRRSF